MPRAHGEFHPAFAEVARLFEKMIPDGRPGGASLVVMHHGEVVVDMAGGTRDERGRPFDRDTLSLSFSTTKGVASTLLHVLASRGEIDYDARVADYWPAFAVGGKDAITVRQVLCHEAGLYSVRALVDDATQIRDFHGMLERIERATPAHTPGDRNAYHALTYGWLVGGLIEKVTGRPLRDVLARELVEPLRLSGCYFGVPDAELERSARLIGQRLATGDANAPRRPRSFKARMQARALDAVNRALGVDPKISGAALLPPGISRFDWTADETLTSCIPAAAGSFDARSLARIYAMLANGGELDGVRLISPETFRALGTVQNRRRDEVIALPMHWRLGYHRVLSIGGRTKSGFGHFGFGGSGAFCDPDRKLSVGFVLNHGVGTPFGDARMWRLNALAMRAADRRRARR